MKRVVIGWVCFLISISSFAKVLSCSSKTEWMKCGEEKLNLKRSNFSYYFKIVKISSLDLETARNQRVNQLAISIGTRNELSGKAITEIETVHGDNTNSNEQFKFVFSNNIGTDVFFAKYIDDYWEYISYPDGSKGYEYYALFAVSASPNAPIYDEFSITRSYGLKPLAMSIVPGWAQMYKGSIGKGIAMIAAEVATIGGIIFTENERATYESKMRSQPNFARQYKAKMDNYETARNCCIGVAAAIYVYNLIDAIVAPGARRVVVKPQNLQFTPVAYKDFSGVTFTYNF